MTANDERLPPAPTTKIRDLDAAATATATVLPFRTWAAQPSVSG